MLERQRFVTQPELSPLDRGSSNEVIRYPSDITPSFLIGLNNKPGIQENLREFQESKDQQNQKLIWVCSDARVWRLLAQSAFYYNTVANGGDPEKLRGAMNAQTTISGSVIAHEPICGGRNAKEDQITKGIFVPDGVSLDRFISCEIDHPSVTQAGYQARRLAETTDKEVSAMVINHESGELKVMAIFNRTDGGPVSHVDTDVFNRRPSRDISADQDISYLSPNELTPAVETEIAVYEAERQALLTAHPSLPDSLQIQNPRIIKYSPDLRAAELWLGALPGEIFRLSTPRRKTQLTNGTKKTELAMQDISQAWEQAEYVLSHAVMNRNTQTESFRDTDTFLIAMPEYSLAQEVAFNLAQQKFSHEWLSDERNKILIAQNNQGVITRAGEMRFRIKDGFVQAAEVVNEAFA